MKKFNLILLCGVILLGVCGCGKDESIKSQFEKLVNSNNTEFIFFERKGKTESNEFKTLLDTDLKEQGVTYTTIDVTNAAYEDLEYLKEKLNLSSNDFDIYIAVIRGSKNVSLIRYKDYDRTMFLLANKNLLKDNSLVLNEYYYKLGKEALDSGFLGDAKRNLDKCLDYLDTRELLNDKRFLLLDTDFGYRVENFSMNGYNLIFSFEYSGGYDNDRLYVSKYECQGVYACLAADTELTSYDAKVIGDTIYLKEKGSTEYNLRYDIEKITSDTLKIKQISWNLKKNY